MKVMTYNVGQWYIGNGSNVPSTLDEDFYNLQNGIIERADADILFINEYRDPFSSAGRTAKSVLSPYFPYIEARNKSSGYMGRAICSKYPLSNYITHNFTKGSASYYYDSAEITVGGKTVTLVVLHLMVNPEANRYLQAQELCDYLKTLDSFIAGGDYNTGISPDYGSDNVNSTAYAHYVKLFTDEGFHSANYNTDGFLITCNDGVDGTGENWMIDNIITSSDISILSAYVDDAKLQDKMGVKTDHMPLIADLLIEPKPYNFNNSFLFSTYQRFAGLSTDEKPTPQGNAVFLELDTAKVYYYKNGAWSILG